MNPRKLMAVALCAAACVTTIAFAEDDFGIESASPVVIADPVNPQPGMLCTVYNYGSTSGAQNWNAAIIGVEGSAPSIRTFVDKGESFSRVQIDKATKTNLIKWEGFLKCKRAGAYAFSFDGRRNGYQSGEWYVFTVNGKKLIKGPEHESNPQPTVNAQLKIGWNKIVIIFECKEQGDVLNVKYRPNGSTSEPRPLTPAMMFHDQKPEEDW